MHFADRINQAIDAKNSVVCVGLDPRLDQIPAFIVEQAIQEHDRTPKAAAEAFITFNKGIIDAVKDIVPAVKPQLAFYEQYGFEGVRAFEETCRYAREAGLIVITDGKRNDIGSTAKAYANAYLGKVELFGSQEEAPCHTDALTVNAYLGFDGIHPFMEACAENENGIFVLVKTSNPSSGDLQDRVTRDEEMSIANLVGHFVEAWGSNDLGDCGYSFVGAVVGATYPKELEELRALMPNTLFLVPGYGAQGGSAEDVKAAFDENGKGALINSSRGIIFAYEKTDTKHGESYVEAAREAAIQMNADLNRVRG